MNNSDDRDILVSKHIHVDRALMLSHGAAVDSFKEVRSPHSPCFQTKHLSFVAHLGYAPSPHKKKKQVTKGCHGYSSPPISASSPSKELSIIM